MEHSQYDLAALSRKADKILAGRGALNAHDRCDVLIFVCIEAGMTTGNEIVSAVCRMRPELKPSFVGIKLKKQAQGFWHKDPTAGYLIN